MAVDYFLNADQSIIRLSGCNQTNTTSIVITFTYNLSIATDATIDIQGTSTPVDGNSSSIVVTIPGPITTPELNVSFTGLHADTTYSIVFDVLSRDNSLACLGVGISDLFFQTDRQRDPTGELLLAAWLYKCHIQAQKLNLYQREPVKLSECLNTFYSSKF